MTQPTQAKIEAAAEAMAEMEAGWVKAEHFTGLAKAALTAAAQVGEPPANERRKVVQKELLTIERDTIERCAQVAENFNAAGKPIATAIRKLKDAP